MEKTSSGSGERTLSAKAQVRKGPGYREDKLKRSEVSKWETLAGAEAAGGSRPRVWSEWLGFVRAHWEAIWRFEVREK